MNIAFIAWPVQRSNNRIGQPIFFRLYDTPNIACDVAYGKITMIGILHVPLHNASSCGSAFSVEHALSCARGGFQIIQHNEVRDLIASLLHWQMYVMNFVLSLIYSQSQGKPSMELCPSLRMGPGWMLLQAGENLL